MGTFVIWDLVRQFGTTGIAGHVNVSQGPTDLSKDGWELGIFPLEELFGALAAAQSDFRAFMSHFVPEMFKHEPAAEVQAALLEEILRVGANAGTCILLDQCLQDYREQVASYDVPTLLVWGVDEKVVAAANGPWLQATQPAAELVVFEESGHCPMWEEPEHFNQVVGDWIAAR
jgi:pimeloyl-ACP methyl ester carboxylesterase